MSFLDSQQDAAEEQGPPGGAPPGGAPGGAPAGPPQGGGPILAALAGRQRQTPVSAPGPGDQANSVTLLQQAMGLMNRALPGLMGQPAYQDVLRALQRINRHFPSQGQPTAGQQQTHMQDFLQNLKKNAMIAMIMGQQKRPPGQSDDQPSGASPLPGAGSSAPMPSTPLPGA